MKNSPAESKRHIYLRHRADAVTRLLAGDSVDAIAGDLGVTPKQVDTWAKEFCSAGENRLRQLPDNWIEKLLTSAEKLVPSASVLSVIIAVTIFVQGQRKEAADRARTETMDREIRVRDAYTALDDKYLDYVRLCLEHPDLDVFDTPLPTRSAPATADQKRREAMVFAMLMSIFERSYLMYNKQNDAFEHNQWNAWSNYMQSWSGRANFRTEWAANRTQYDADFAAYLDKLMTAAPTTQPLASQ